MFGFRVVPPLEAGGRGGLSRGGRGGWEFRGEWSADRPEYLWPERVLGMKDEKNEVD